LLLTNENNFYLCTDPFDGTNEISEHDQDYILAKEIVAMELAEGSE
jgi:3'-phosphoadenosine 5'-phosphosulfate (PAPS) 3'-phosphatase